MRRADASHLHCLTQLWQGSVVHEVSDLVKQSFCTHVANEWNIPIPLYTAADLKHYGQRIASRKAAAALLEFALDQLMLQGSTLALLKTYKCRCMTVALRQAAACSKHEHREWAMNTAHVGTDILQSHLVGTDILLGQT